MWTDDGVCRSLHQSVVAVDQMITTLPRLLEEFSPGVAVIGNGTASSETAKIIRGLNIPIEIVDESYTSELARKLYFVENPPHGLRRLIPTSFQTPPRPYDDYVAIILARRYFGDDV